MRFSSAALLALPLLAAASESPFEQYKAQFQNFLGSFGASAPKAAEPAEPAGAAEADAPQPPQPAEVPPEVKPLSAEVNLLNLDNWKHTLYSNVKPDATKPDEWWVLLTGANKTCYGRCLKLDAAFNEAAYQFASIPDAPHMAVLDCEQQPVLCNSWSVTPGGIWAFQMLPEPAAIDIYSKRFNLSSVTGQTLVDLHAANSKEDFKIVDSYFHPFHGFAAEKGLAVPFGYITWAFGLIPSWATMLGISMFSRSFMSRRFGPQAGGPARAPPRAAPAGDGRS